MNWLDLVVFTGAVYGIAWVIARSELLRRPREAVAAVPFLGRLVRCVVCTGAWVGLGLMALLPWTTLFGGRLRAGTPADGAFLLGWVVASIWALARLLGDGD